MMDDVDEVRCNKEKKKGKSPKEEKKDILFFNFKRFL